MYPQRGTYIPSSWLLSQGDQIRTQNRQRFEFGFFENGLKSHPKRKYYAIKEEDFYQVAMIATKGDKVLSKLISEAVSKTDLIKVEKTQRT